MGTPTLVCVRSCPNLVLQLVGPLGVSIKVYDLVSCAMNSIAASRVSATNGVWQGFAAAQAVLITGASQSRQHGKSESDLTSHPPQSLFDVGSRRIAIVTGNTLSVLAISQG
ncbi:hypothetical protein Tco_1020391 [Tanacetum coccineum]|uniref:Uncharacterized protein n=1 Tax=Tanacetum coccineum TaxID=301880 RepID=A0ABQ5FZV8_9ASTR